MASTKQMQDRARQARRAAKTKIHLVDSSSQMAVALKQCQIIKESSGTRILKAPDMETFEMITGHLPYVFENIEIIGLDVSDNMGEEDDDLMSESLSVNIWQDLIVETTIYGQDKPIYFGIRLGNDGASVQRPGYGDYIQLTAMELALARFALSTNLLSWYCHSRGDVRIGLFNQKLTSKQAADYYYAAKTAADALRMTQVFRFLD